MWAVCMKVFNETFGTNDHVDKKIYINNGKKITEEIK